MKETKAHSTDELAGVYRDYFLEVWTKALNLTGVPTALKWRRVENIYYPQDLRETPEPPLGPKIDVAPATTALK